MSDINELDPNAQALVRPGYSFKGKELAKYSLGIKLLWFNVVDSKKDHYTWLIFSLLYLLSISRKEAQTLAFDKTLFREKCLQWADTLDEADIEEAATLFNDITTRAETRRVEVDGGTPDPNGVSHRDGQLG